MQIKILLDFLQKMVYDEMLKIQQIQKIQERNITQEMSKTMPEYPLTPNAPPSNPFIILTKAVELIKDAEILQINDESIRRKVKAGIEDGSIIGKKIGKDYFVRLLSLRKWIKELQEEGI